MDGMYFVCKVGFNFIMLNYLNFEKKNFHWYEIDFYKSDYIILMTWKRKI